MNNQENRIQQVAEANDAKTSANFVIEREIAYAELVEDIRAWDAQAQHRTGTDGDRITSEVLMRRLANSDVQVEIVEFPFSRRVPKHCYVQTRAQRIEGIPLFDGGETQAEISGFVVNAGDEGEFAVGFASAVGSPANHALFSYRDSSTYRALIGISRNETAGIAMLNADAYLTPHGLPILIVDGRYESFLQEAIRARQPINLNVAFDIEQTIATNVQATVVGTNPKLKPVVVMTPKSSWWTSTAERCGGIAAWLAVVRAVAASPPTRTVIFTANTGHELGHVGLDHFLEQNPDLAQGAHVWVHLGANFAAKDSQVRIQYSNETLGERLRQHLHSHQVEIAGEVPSSTRPGGEARNIFDAGGNYVSLLGSNGLFHHPDDRMANNVDMNRAMRSRNAVVSLVKDLSGDDGNAP